MNGRCNSCGHSGPLGEDFYSYIPTKCKPCYFEYQRQYRRGQATKNVSKDKKYALRKRYGLSPRQFEGMLAATSGCCAACGEPPRPGGRALSVDHDHSTGQVRGLLCNACNRAVGYLRDDPSRATAVARYLTTAQALTVMGQAVASNPDDPTAALIDTIVQLAQEATA